LRSCAAWWMTLSASDATVPRLHLCSIVHARARRGDLRPDKRSLTGLLAGPLIGVKRPGGSPIAPDEAGGAKDQEK